MLKETMSCIEKGDLDARVHIDSNDEFQDCLLYTSLEVVSVGVMYYTALMPCMIASLVASGFAAGMGVTPEAFHVVDIPKLTIETGLKMGAIAVGCAVISIVFLSLIHI